MNFTDSNGIVKMFECISSAMTENREYLIRLDNEIGDGDLGITMQKGFLAAYEYAKNNFNKLPWEIVAYAGMEIIKVAPSTMGTLMGSGLLKGGKAIGNEPLFSGKELKLFYKGFLDGVVLRGKAKPGDKTIVDILEPICEEIDKEQENNLSVVASMAYQGAKIGLENEKAMMSQHGKAAVFREKTINMIDPGSAAMVIFAEAISKSFE